LSAEERESKDALAVLVILEVDEEKAELTEDERLVLTNEIRATAARLLGDWWVVLTQENMADILARGDSQTLGCTSRLCAFDLGSSLDAAIVVSGYAGRFQSKLAVTLQLHDTVNRTSMGEQTARASNVEELSGQVRAAARRLLLPLVPGVEVRFETIPSGATLTLANGQACTTPCSAKLDPGQYAIKAQHSWEWEVVRDSVEVQPSQTHFHWRLERSAKWKRQEGKRQAKEADIERRRRIAAHNQPFKSLRMMWFRPTLFVGADGEFHVHVDMVTIVKGRGKSPLVVDFSLSALTGFEYFSGRNYWNWVFFGFGVKPKVFIDWPVPGLYLGLPASLSLGFTGRSHAEGSFSGFAAPVLGYLWGVEGAFVEMQVGYGALIESLSEELPESENTEWDSRIHFGVLASVWIGF